MNRDTNELPSIMTELEEGTDAIEEHRYVFYHKDIPIILTFCPVRSFRLPKSCHRHTYLS